MISIIIQEEWEEEIFGKKDKINYMKESGLGYCSYIFSLNNNNYGICPFWALIIPEPKEINTVFNICKIFDRGNNYNSKIFNYEEKCVFISIL